MDSAIEPRDPPVSTHLVLGLGAQAFYRYVEDPNSTQVISPMPNQVQFMCAPESQSQRFPSPHFASAGNMLDVLILDSHLRPPETDTERTAEEPV